MYAYKQKQNICVDVNRTVSFLRSYDAILHHILSLRFYAPEEPIPMYVCVRFANRLIGPVCELSVTMATCAFADEARCVFAVSFVIQATFLTWLGYGERQTGVSPIRLGDLNF